jgi:hypothetical protein
MDLLVVLLLPAGTNRRWPFNFLAVSITHQQGDARREEEKHQAQRRNLFETADDDDEAVVAAIGNDFDRNGCVMDLFGHCLPAGSAASHFRRRRPDEDCFDPYYDQDTGPLGRRRRRQ